jgi:hypothetical protein
MAITAGPGTHPGSPSVILLYYQHPGMLPQWGRGLLLIWEFCPCIGGNSLIGGQFQNGNRIGGQRDGWRREEDARFRGSH